MFRPRLLALLLPALFVPQAAAADEATLVPDSDETKVVCEILNGKPTKWNLISPRRVIIWDSRGAIFSLKTKRACFTPDVSAVEVRRKNSGRTRLCSNKKHLIKTFYHAGSNTYPKKNCEIVIVEKVPADQYQDYVALILREPD